MSVRITNNTPQLLNERRNKVSLAIRFMLEATHRGSTSKTPKRHGNLRADIVKSVQGQSGMIVWDKNYAVYQEAGVTHGTVMKNYTTPGTGAHYAKNAVRDTVKDAQKYFKMAGL